MACINYIYAMLCRRHFLNHHSLVMNLSIWWIFSVDLGLCDAILVGGHQNRGSIWGPPPPQSLIKVGIWWNHIIMVIHNTLNQCYLVTRQYIEVRVYFLFCSKSFDMDLCPLPFGTDSDKMYHFISERFDDNSAYVQEQALQWLQVCNLSINQPFNATKVFSG